MNGPLPEQLYCCLKRQVLEYSLGLGLGCASLFEEAAQKFLCGFELGPEYRHRTKHDVRATEAHSVFLNEIFPADDVSVLVQILDVEAQGLHCLYHIHNDSRICWVARQEAFYSHLNLTTNKLARIPKKQLEALMAIRSRHRSLPRVGVGREIKLITES